MTTASFDGEGQLQGNNGGGLAGGEGVLGFIVWPTHAGAVNTRGEEPMFTVDYARGQIYWALNEHGLLRGRAIINVPAGEWAWIIYCHNPLEPGFITAQKLAHTLVLYEAGTIELSEITEDEVKPLNPDPVLHD
ncbi:MAG TPA: hypothetical protein VMS84_07465 [Mycobacterium sp.]|nr:hypothetical protein [Mycobacterium sp.]